MNIFEHNAAELVKLHDKVHETWRHRGESPQRKAAWGKAIHRFHAGYDELAFPADSPDILNCLKPMIRQQSKCPCAFWKLTHGISALDITRQPSSNIFASTR